MAQPTASIPEPLRSRVLWSAILMGVVLWLAVASFLRARNVVPANPGVTLLVWMAVAIGAGGFLASRVVAARGQSPDPARARTRMIVQLALCEVGAVLGGIAWFLTGDPWSWGAVGISLLGMLLAFPSRPSVAPQPGPRVH